MAKQRSRNMRVQRVILLGFVIVLALVAVTLIVNVLDLRAAQSSFADYQEWVGTQVADTGQGDAVFTKLNTTLYVMIGLACLVIIAGIVVQWWLSRGIGRMVRAASNKIAKSSAELLAVA